MEYRYQSTANNRDTRSTEWDSIRKAAQRVNLTIQSVLHQETLLLKQLQSIEEEEEETTITSV